MVVAQHPPEKGMEAERSTEVTFFFMYHTLSCLGEFKKRINEKPPNVLVLEEERNHKFLPMLEGKISMEEYLKDYEWSVSKEFVKERNVFLQKLHKERPEIRMEQVGPRSFLEGMLRQGAAYEVFSSMLKGNFDDITSAFADRAMLEGRLLDRYHEDRRVDEIAKNIRSGEWHGEILVEAGGTHTGVRNILIDRLKNMDNVKINPPIHAARGIAEKTFGRLAAEVHSPEGELGKIYMRGKEPSEEMRKLLGARAVIFQKITSMPKGGGTDFDFESEEMRAIKMVNQLSYEECKQLFNEINPKMMGRGVAFKSVEDYLKKRDVRKTEIVFFFEHHTLPSLKLFKEYVETNKPDILVLEQGKDDKFEQMLEGKIGVAEYLKGGYYVHREYLKELFPFLKKLRKEGVRIEELASEDEARSIETSGIEKRLPHKELRVSLKEAVSSFLKKSDRGFEYAVGKRIELAQRNGVRYMLRDAGRAWEIAEKVKTGEWSGRILVQVHSAHSQARELLAGKLRGVEDTSISAVYPFRNAVSEVFESRTSDVHQPAVELERICAHEAFGNKKMVSWETKKTLAARDMLHGCITESIATEADERRDYEATKLVNQLSYEECRELFNKVRYTRTETAFGYVEDYLRERDGNAFKGHRLR
jgi:hypothetical protein